MGFRHFPTFFAETALESSDYSSESSESFTSEDSFFSDLGPGSERLEDGKQGGSQECITISSDEESMELELPSTPSAPLTPGAQLELCAQHWSEQEAEVNQHSADPLETCELDKIIKLHDVDKSQETLLLLSPLGLPGLCLMQMIMVLRVCLLIIHRCVLRPDAFFTAGKYYKLNTKICIDSWNMPPGWFAFNIVLHIKSNLWHLNITFFPKQLWIV